MEIQKNLALSETYNIDTVIPNGEIWTIEKVICSGCHADFTATLTWDVSGTAEYIFSSNIPADVTMEKTLIGDGTKILRMTITNKSVATTIAVMHVYHKVS